MKDLKLSLKKGNPSALGVTRIEGGVNFALAAPEGKEVRLLIYPKGVQEPQWEFVLGEECRTGSVYAVCVSGADLEGCEYNYQIGDQVEQDPYAAVLRGLGGFGELPDPESPHRVRCGFFPEKLSSWEEESRPFTPYEDTVIYKVHVRGYTMHKNSRVRCKGAFAGLQEKIPYFKELGITALELMPAYEFREIMAPEEMPLEYVYKIKDKFPLNYWGYTRGYYFAPKAAYSYGDDPIQEFRELVEALHKAGIECIMEFYFPRGVNPSMAAAAVRHWKMQYHVDGFHLVGDGVPRNLLASDPLLGRTKLLFGAVDPGEAGGEWAARDKNLAECSEGFKQDMRRWLKGDEDSLEPALNRLRRNPKGYAAVNYMANQDGFTLQDAVSYERKHNEANMEENQDGVSHNYSWNCGVEGPTRKKSVRALRTRQMRNAFLMLLFSQGVPMIYGGDEFGNSQQGNNNAYCQDNEIGWVDWSRARRNQDLADFVKEAIAFRKAHRTLHMRQEPQGVDYRCLGYPDISYHGQRAWYGDLEPVSRHIGVMYCEGYGSEDGQEKGFLYLAFNLHWEPQRLALPHLPAQMNWTVALKTCLEEEPEEPRLEEDFVLVPARAIVALLADGEAKTKEVVAQCIPGSILKP